MKQKKLLYLLIPFAQIVLTFCSDRIETPIKSGNSTMEYPSKSQNGIEATITFCEKISMQTGDPIKAGTAFTIKEKAKVYTIVNLINRKFYMDEELMFHIDWLDSSGNSLFKKRIDVAKNDSSTTLTSSISISPDKRQPGNYSLRVYLYRELIAEKKFDLINLINDSIPVIAPDLAENIKARITFCRSVSKKTGKLIGAGNKFTINDKAKVLAIIKLENKDTSDTNLTFFAEWIGPNESSFYRKKINISSKGSSISSSISISPEKRQPGKYLLRVYLFEKIISEANFELIKAEKKGKIVSTKTKAENVATRIIFCEKINKKTDEPIDPDTVFTINNIKNVTAIIYIEKRDTSSRQPMSFLIDWIGPEGSSFYKKEIKFLPSDSITKMSSSISISSKKRQPGNYLLRVYLSKELIGEKIFSLQ